MKKKRDPKTIHTIISDNNMIPGSNQYKAQPDPEVTFNRVKTPEEVQYWKRVYNPELKKISDAEVVYSMVEMKAAIKSRGEVYLNRFEGKKIPFEVDIYNEGVIEMLCQYFTNDPSFEKIRPDYSLKKSIMLRSNERGTGKTLLMKLFSWGALWPDEIKFKSFYTTAKVINCRKIVSEYRRSGEKMFEQYCDLRGTQKAANTWVFDELGREDLAANSFGNKTNVMEKVMADRYDLFIDHGVKTHLTTNIVNKKDLEDRYGDYLVSRMREMYNIIEMPGKDRRK